MPEPATIKLRPVVRFREFPFGTAEDPSMREFMREEPWEGQERLLGYLRSGRILGLPMGADLTDRFDPPSKANPQIRGRTIGGTTPMTDGVWFWYAGLIHFVERYNVRLPQEFVDHAARCHWVVSEEGATHCRYEYSYF